MALEAATGKKIWALTMQDDLKGEMMSGWGYTESLLVDGDKLVCSPGGSLGTLAALDKRTGKVIWRSKDLKDRAAYSSIIAGEVDGIRQYIQMTGTGVAGVAAVDGRLLWRSDLGYNGTAIVPTPIFHDNAVYVTSGYGAGCGLIHLRAQGQSITAEKVYANKEMANHHGGVVLLGGYVFGYSDSRGWTYQDFASGKVAWAERAKLSKGSVTCADNHFYCYSENDGTVVLLDASAAGWKEEGRLKMPKQSSGRSSAGRIWTHPVISGGRLFLRDQGMLYCYDIGQKANGPPAPAATEAELAQGASGAPGLGVPVFDYQPKRGLPTIAYVGGICAIILGILFLVINRRMANRRTA
jgi:outer membrane protein assembly factor BamB